MIKFNIPYSTSNQIDALTEVISSNKFSGGGQFGSRVKELLLKEYQFKNTYLTTSCTSAIQLCAMSLNLQPGDEVIMPSFTFPSTPTPFIQAGAQIVFADCGSEYPNTTLSSIKAVTTVNTKAIMVVHYGGYNAEIDLIANFCKQESIILIEDAAQAIDACHNEKPLGSFGDFSVFSFHETKNINCGEGGLLVVNSEDYIEQINQIFEYGTNRTDFLNGNINSYEWVGLGLSFVLSEINCAMLYSQLLMVKNVTKHRRLLWETYFTELNDLTKKHQLTLSAVQTQNSNFHTFYIALPNKKSTASFIAFMQQNNIQCTTHYFPLHESKYGLTNYKSNTQLTNASYFGSCLVRLPLHFNLTQNQVLTITSHVKEFFESH